MFIGLFVCGDKMNSLSELLCLQPLYCILFIVTVCVMAAHMLSLCVPYTCVPCAVNQFNSLNSTCTQFVVVWVTWFSLTLISCMWEGIFLLVIHPVPATLEPLVCARARNLRTT